MNNLITSPSLSFSIIGSDINEVNKIRSAFQQVSIALSLHAVYNSVNNFIRSETKTGLPDFIAMNEVSFKEFEEKNISVAAPVILFSDDHVEGLHNLVFESVSFPVNYKMLEVILRKFTGIRDFFSAKEEFNYLQEGSTFSSKTFMIKRGKEFHLINSDDIPVFYTDKKITFAFDKSGKKFIIHLTLIELESLLNPGIFFRANRQFLINRSYINKIKQIDDLKFEIVISHIDLIGIYINHQKFSKLKTWIETNKNRPGL